MRIMIADDALLLRSGVVESLTRRGVDVVGEASTADDLWSLLAGTPADLVVLDIRMPPGYSDEGIRLAERIRPSYPALGLLVLSQHGETSYAQRLLECANRSVGYLLKDRVQDVDRLHEAIQRVAAGEVVIDPEIVQRVLLRPRVASPLDRLTPGERQVLALMAEGCSNGAIAEKLNYVLGTVEKRITAIGQKLGLPPADDPARTGVNLRVLAVLAYLRDAGSGRAGGTQPANRGPTSPIA